MGALEYNKARRTGLLPSAMVPAEKTHTSTAGLGGFVFRGRKRLQVMALPLSTPRGGEEGSQDWILKLAPGGGSACEVCSKQPAAVVAGCNLVLCGTAMLRGGQAQGDFCDLFGSSSLVSAGPAPKGTGLQGAHSCPSSLEQRGPYAWVCAGDFPTWCSQVPAAGSCLPISRLSPHRMCGCSARSTASGTACSPLGPPRLL